MPFDDVERLQFLDHLRDAVIGINPFDGSIALWNQNATAILGYSSAAALGRPIETIIPDLHLARLNSLTALVGTEAPVAASRGSRVESARLLDLRAVRDDGFELQVEVSLSEGPGHHGSESLVVAIVRDITMRRMIEQRAVQAFRDPLTGLPNRALFLDRLEQALLRDDRAGGSVALLFLDLDRFKVINDSLGHQIGDRLLVAASKRIQGSLRAEDTASRLGGDEFTVLLEGIHDVREAVAVTERIADELRAPFQLGEHEVFVSCSVGIALAAKDTQPEDLLRDADVAMYRAKRQGKARYVVFDPSMNAHALERLRLENELRRAVERQEFVIYYQPIVRLASGRMQSIEALLRWQHPRRGLLLPRDFLHLAEEMGLMTTIGHWVLSEACAFTRLLHERGGAFEYPSVSVNLSARQFHQPTLADDVARVLRQSGLAPGQLQLEIPESVVMEDVQATTIGLQALAQLGVRLTIDDFGTGFSSVVHLRRFPVSDVKIDESLVAGLGRGQDDDVIVAAMVVLASALDYTVVAEGVERAEQVQRLRTLGCDAAQGSYFAAPLPPDELRRLEMPLMALAPEPATTVPSD